MSSVFPFDRANAFNPNLGYEQGELPIDQNLPNDPLTYTIEEEVEEVEEGDPDFYENLAEKLSDTELTGLAATLTDAIKEDLESRADWENTINLIYKYLGFKPDEFRQMPFLQRASAALDSTLSSALLRFFATARAELFPAAGPARAEIVGSPDEKTEDEGERVKIFLNHYLTTIDRDYYPDSERLLMYVGFYGCAFRKVYQDPILKRPLARLITPQDFIINNHTTSIMSSSRITEVLMLSRKDVLLRQQCGDFIEFELPKISEDNDEQISSIDKTIKRSEGISLDASENKSLFKFYEVHCELSANEIENSVEDEQEIPRPYIVTICCIIKKVVSIRRNWKEDDDKFQRKNYYVHYSYIPGFGIYSLGLAQLGGSNAMALTAILRQLLDAGTLKNFPGGLVAKGMRLENNDKAIGPASWVEVETGSRPLADCILPMPYGEPSAALIELRKELKDESSMLISATETKIPELGSNAPVGTTLAVLEVATQVQSCVLRSLHCSVGYELTLLFNLFGEHLPNEPYPFKVPGKEISIMKQDFSDRINIVPVSDPNVLTSTHRLMRNEALLKLAQTAPEIHDLREAYRRMYQSMNIENIDEILPSEPEPLTLDPMAENTLLLINKTVYASSGQDHEAHKIVHKALEAHPAVQGNPITYATLLMHIQEHACLVVYEQMYRQQTPEYQQMQQQIPMQLQQFVMQGIPPEQAEAMLQQQLTEQLKQIPIPPITPEQLEEIMKMPEVQNMVARQDAQRIIEEEQRHQQAMESQLDINKVAMADVEQKREAAHLKAAESEAKVAAEKMKTQLQFEAEMTKTQSQQDIARDKHEVDLLIAQNRTQQNRTQ